MTLPHDPLWPRAGAWPAPADKSGWDAVVLGVPAWRTSLSPTGAHATPAAVREALRRFSPALIGPPPVDLSEMLRIADAGDIASPDGPEGEASVRAAVRELSATAGLVIALGGDNSATYAVAQGAGATGLITIDAHFDLRDGVSNGSPVRRLVEDGLDPRRIVQLGIADFANSTAYARRAADIGITVITLDEVRRRGAADVVAQALEIAGAGEGPVHLDIDVDVCDRSVAPGCPASVPGGLAAWELRALVRAAASDPRLRSADIVEVDATADAPDGRTVRLAALCVLELLAGKAVAA
ncbi:formimidoylglutamase [Microbacterium sp. Root166]|uniref:agmatinase family protein n=1 Tax=Microbacterium sp. Root166 TaxID=1736478 RepID=UPI0006F716A5|nr:agmatinase family protein [Microbacterium sp. Root166]KQZ83295.1 formimidoylglutamase [Microbacterium sp. Root166]